MRLFVALDINDEIRKRIELFIEGVRGFAPDARWVRADSLHVTLKFIGEQPEAHVNAVQGALAAVRGTAIDLSFKGAGFFPNPKNAQVFWIGIQAGEALANLAAAVDQALESVGVTREKHAYTPHLTLARGKGGSGAPHRRRDDRQNTDFAKLQEKLSSLHPDFGTMTGREFFLYHSQLSPKGSSYRKIARFSLS